MTRTFWLGGKLLNAATRLGNTPAMLVPLQPYACRPLKPSTVTTCVRQESLNEMYVNVS